jgi:hypothetical protein
MSIVTVRLLPRDTTTTSIEVEVRILAHPNVDPTGGRSLGPARPSLWRPLKSNGTLEREWTQAIEQACRAHPSPSPNGQGPPG